jgi:hypothetical protein
MIDARFRPLPIWPHETTPSSARRSRYTFKASWQQTLDLLENELRLLKATDITIGCGLRDNDIRNDGWPRSNVPNPVHPGVEVSFTTRHGRLVYATDVCADWQHNVRSIALGLQALRAVDRYGITERGQQYAGFKELMSATSEPSIARGQQLIAEYGGVREALRALHPDSGGDEADFKAVVAVKELPAE